MDCDHCAAIRFRQAQIAWGGQPLTGSMPLPMKYYSSADSPGMYDGDPGPCSCWCHAIWRRVMGTHS